jgi:hypothetical protein
VVSKKKVKGELFGKRKRKQGVVRVREDNVGWLWSKYVVITISQRNPVFCTNYTNNYNNKKGRKNRKKKQWSFLVIQYYMVLKSGFYVLFKLATKKESCVINIREWKRFLSIRHIFGYHQAGSIIWEFSLSSGHCLPHTVGVFQSGFVV